MSYVVGQKLFAVRSGYRHAKTFHDFAIVKVARKYMYLDGPYPDADENRTEVAGALNGRPYRHDYRLYLSREDYERTKREDAIWAAFERALRYHSFGLRRSGVPVEDLQAAAKLLRLDLDAEVTP